MSYACLLPGMVRAFTLTKVFYRLDFAPQFTLSDPTHIGGFILKRSGINMSRRNRRDGEIRELLTIMGEKGDVVAFNEDGERSTRN